MKKTLFALAIAALAYAPAAFAQDHAAHGGGSHAQMMQQHLGLTAEQAARMEAIHAELRAAHREHCDGLRAAGADDARKEALHQRMRESMQRTHERAAAVLTAEQRARMDSMHASHHGPGGQHAMQHGGAARGTGNDAAHHAAMHGSAQGGHAQHAAHQGGAHAQHAGAGAAGHGEHAQGCCDEECCDGCKDGKCDEGTCAECCKVCCGEGHMAGHAAPAQGGHGAHGAGHHGSHGTQPRN